MHVSPDTMRLLMELEAPAEQKVALLKAMEADWLTYAPPTINGINEERERLRNENTKAERKRAADRERMAAKREAERVAKEVARQTATVPSVACDSRATVASDTRDCEATVAATPSDASYAQVVYTTSSLRSEGTQEPNGSFVDAPTPIGKPADPEKPKTKPPKAHRGTRLAPDWEPSSDEFAMGLDAGLTPEEINRAALEFRNYWCSRSRDALKLSWRLTWQNRVNDLAERKRERGARLASAAATPGGRGRRPSSFADIYAERHGFTAVRE